MADYREMMDTMRREGQMEQAKRVGSTAMRAAVGEPGSRPEPVNPVWYEGPKPRGYARVTESGKWEMPLSPGVYRGSGGYEYELREDGSLKIVKSPKSTGGQEIIPGAFVHDIVMNDIKREKAIDSLMADESPPLKIPEPTSEQRARIDRIAKEREIERLEFKPMAAAIEFEPNSTSMMAKK